MRQFLFILLCAVCLCGSFSCDKSDSPDPGPVNDGSLTIIGEAYGSDPAQKMDIYLPGGRTAAATKVLILVHGGGWSGGDKTDYNPYIDTLKKRLPGYAIYNINYRLFSSASGQNRFPVQENDVKAAMDYIFSKSAEHQVSQRCIMLGQSAGGHLALLYAYKSNPDKKVKAVAAYFPPTDLGAYYATNGLVALSLQAVTGSTPALNPTIYTQSSPTTFVTAQTIPTILFHGGADPVVDVSQSVILNNALQTAGVPRQFVLYPAEVHGFSLATLTDSFNKMVPFFSTHNP